MLCRTGLLRTDQAAAASVAPALRASLHTHAGVSSSVPSIHSTTQLTLLRHSDPRARCEHTLRAHLHCAADLRYPCSPLSLCFRAARPPTTPRSPSKTAPELFSPFYARVLHTFILLRQSDAPLPSRIGVCRFFAAAQPFLTAKQAFLCHHHHRVGQPPKPLRTPVRCRPFQPAGATQRPSRHATQARRRFRHLNPSPPTTTLNADVIA